MKEPSFKEKAVEDLNRIRLDRVFLEGFRNYQALSVGLCEGFNVLAGPNGQGKTNFLEAIYLIATTRLLRGQKDAEAIMDGEEKAEVRLELSESGTLLGVALARGTRKRAFLNGLALPRAADLIGRLPAVCITSEDMSIVRGEPADRRLFLDMEMSAHSPAYLRHLTVYKRALEQRNAIIRAAREAFQPDELWSTWEEQIAEHGFALRELRNQFVDQIGPSLIKFHERMGGGEQVSMVYVQRDQEESAQALTACLARSRDTDVHRGSTGVGPHRDDLLLEVGGREARLFGSQGQQRTCVIALKLATLDFSVAQDGTVPLLLLDDVFSDLDEDRRSMLVKIVLDLAGQTVLTCTEAGAAGNEILELASVFNVVGGTISAA